MLPQTLDTNIKMAVFRPVSRNIATTPQSSQDYLAMIEELSRLRRPTDVAMGFGTDRTPMAFALPQARGVQQILPGSQLKTPVTPTSAVQPVQQISQQPTQQIQPSRDRNKPQSVDVLEKIIQVATPQEVGRDQDGNIYYNNNTVKDVTGITTDLNTGQIIDVEPEFITGFLSDPSLMLTRDGQVFRNITSSFQPTGKASSDIQRLLFSNQEYQITQPFGAYNPNPYYQYHQGLDIAGAGNWQVPISLPFEAQVVGKLIDGVNDQGYGNSLLVQLPTGERLRLSHLSQANFNIGDTIRPGQVIGITGTTGNSTGYHLDLEYYDENGRVQDPYNFVNKIAENPTNYQVSGRVKVDYADLSPQDRQEAFYWKLGENKVTEEDRQLYGNDIAVAEDRRTRWNEARNNRIQDNIAGNGMQTEAQTQQPQVLSSRVANLGERLNLPDIGVSELLAGDVLGATQKASETGSRAIASIGTATNLPELGVSEKVADIPNLLSRGQQLAQNILGNLLPKAEADETDVQQATTEGLNVKSSLNEARGLLQSIGSMQPGNLTKTGINALRGMATSGFNQPTNPIPQDETTPVGQTGFSGNTLVSGVQGQTRVPTQTPQVTEQEQTTQQRVQQIFSGQKQQPFTQQKSTSNQKSSSGQKSTSGQKTTTTTQTKAPVSQPKPQTKAQTAYKAPTTTKTLYGQKVTPKPTPKSAPKPAPKPQPQSKPKTNVFQKAVSKISVFKKK